MRLLSLNLWGGKLHDPLLEFIKRESAATDIFCFQEMVRVLGAETSGDLFSEIARVLPEHQGFFEPTQDEAGGREVGPAMFIKRTEPVDREGDVFVYRTRNAMLGSDWRTSGRNVQFIELPFAGKEYAIANFHGLADGKGREDSDDRLEEARKVKLFLKTLGGTKIVCGDFNLTLNTQSLAIIDDGMRNLIKESGVTSTRSKFFEYEDRFCDYILVDKTVNVKDFRVLPDEVSDHLPLVLEFEP